MFAKPPGDRRLGPTGAEEDIPQFSANLIAAGTDTGSNRDNQVGRCAAEGARQLGDSPAPNARGCSAPPCVYCRNGSGRKVANQDGDAVGDLYGQQEATIPRHHRVGLGRDGGRRRGLHDTRAVHLTKPHHLVERHARIRRKLPPSMAVPLVASLDPQQSRCPSVVERAQAPADKRRAPRAVRPLEVIARGRKAGARCRRRGRLRHTAIIIRGERIE